MLSECFTFTITVTHCNHLFKHKINPYKCDVRNSLYSRAQFNGGKKKFNVKKKLISHVMIFMVLLAAIHIFSRRPRKSCVMNEGIAPFGDADAVALLAEDSMTNEIRHTNSVEVTNCTHILNRSSSRSSSLLIEFPYRKKLFPSKSNYRQEISFCRNAWVLQQREDDSAKTKQSVRLTAQLLLLDDDDAI